MHARPRLRRSPHAAREDAGVQALVHAVEDDLEALADEWDSLVDRVQGGPFARPGWFAAWWHAFGVGDLVLVTIRHESRLVSVLPLARRRGTISSLANEHTPTFPFLADGCRAGQKAAETPFLLRPGHVSFAYLSRTSDQLEYLVAAARAARFPVAVRTIERPQYVDLEGDWAAYERGLGANLRADLRRCLRRLGEHGRVWLDVSFAEDDLERRLEECFRVEVAGWKGTTGSAIVSRPQTERFYRELAAWAASRGSLRLAVLRVDERAVAFHFALEEDRAYYALKGGYDPAYARCSPGKLLIDATLRRASSAGLRRYELLGDPAPYKLRWATGSHELVLFEAFAPTPLRLVGWAVAAHGRPLAKRGLDVARRSRFLRHAGNQSFLS